MSKFGDLLRKDIVGSGISVRALSMECQINRTLFQKYLSGDRLPKNQWEVKRIANVLTLSPDRESELLEEYYKSFYGENLYHSMVYMKEILEGLKDHKFSGTVYIEPAMRANDFPEENCGHTILRGTFQIQEAVRTLVLQRAAKKKAIKIRILAQPDNEAFMRAIQYVSENEYVSVEHIICLDQNTGSNVDNVSVFRRILPLILGRFAYQICYYYDCQKSHWNKMNLMPNLIMVGDHVVLGNVEMDACIIYHKAEICRFYLEQYEEIRKFTLPLTTVCEKHEGNCDEVETCCSGIRYCVNRLSALPGVTSIFPLERFRDLAERRQIPENFIQTIRSGEAYVLFIKAGKMELDEELTICFGQNCIFKYEMKNGRNKFFCMNESSIRRTLFECVAFAKVNEWVYSEEESLQILEEICQNCR